VKTWFANFAVNLNLYRYVLAPTDGVTLGLFRIGFAAALFMQAQKWADVAHVFLKSGTLLSYPMFAWVPPPAPWLGDLEVWGLHICPLFIGAGIFTRVAMVGALSACTG
jgi:hypothetical protein